MTFQVTIKRKWKDIKKKKRNDEGFENLITTTTEINFALRSSRVSSEDSDGSYRKIRALITFSLNLYLVTRTTTLSHNSCLNCR